MISTLVNAVIGLEVMNVTKKITKPIKNKHCGHGKYCRCLICIRKRKRN